MTTFADDMQPTLTKSHGEGSRGGHIIGHTKSGKPVYVASSSHYANTRRPLEAMSTSSPLTHTHMMAAKGAILAHPRWLAEDHRDAAKIHELAKLMPDTYGQKAAAGHVAFAHRKAADWLGKSSLHVPSLPVSSLSRLTDLAKAEGARGGHIIGHTKSGKPIYEARGTKRELLHKLDHGINHVAVASSLKHKHYIGMTSTDHFTRAAKHQAKAVGKFKAARKAGSVADAVKTHRLGQQHMSLSRAHAMMGQLSADVRMPDHIRRAALMGVHTSHFGIDNVVPGDANKNDLAQTKERYFSTLGKAGHQRALSRHTRLKDEAVKNGHGKTADHHDIFANAHRAILAHHYRERETT